MTFSTIRQYVEVRPDPAPCLLPPESSLGCTFERRSARSTWKSSSDRCFLRFVQLTGVSGDIGQQPDCYVSIPPFSQPATAAALTVGNLELLLLKQTPVRPNTSSAFCGASCHCSPALSSRQVNAATSIDPCGMCKIAPTALDIATGQVGDKEVFTFRHDASGEGEREEKGERERGDTRLYTQHTPRLKNEDSTAGKLCRAARCARNTVTLCICVGWIISISRRQAWRKFESSSRREGAIHC